MHQESRIKKTLINARINLIFYFLTLALTFFSRNIFLNTLGADFIGLTSTLQNLLSFLNLAELGIGSAIGYVLYKPLYEKDQTKINDILSVFGYLYRRIGLIILVGGCLLACFLPFIFPDTIFQAGVIYFAYFSYLTSSLIGYFINYRQTLLGADQRNYVVTTYFQTGNLVKTIIQLGLAYYTRNYYLWIAIELLFGILYSFILNWKINQIYPWLKSSVANGKEKYADNKVIITKAKQLFIHQVSGMASIQLIPFLVYAFSSLKIAAYYGNYMIIISKMIILATNTLNSVEAGIGNLIAEGNTKKIKKVYWGLFYIRINISSIIIYGIYQSINPFISLWLGEEYILDPIIPNLILFQLFISTFNYTQDQFIHGYGLFHDTWLPAASLAVTVTTAVVGGFIWGLPGVLLGEIASALFLAFPWKPYFLFKYGFKESSKKYWFRLPPLLIMLAATWYISQCTLTAFVRIDPYQTLAQWVYYTFLHVSLFSVILLTCCAICFSEFRSICSAMLKITKK